MRLESDPSPGAAPLRIEDVLTGVPGAGASPPGGPAPLRAEGAETSPTGMPLRWPGGAEGASDGTSGSSGGAGGFSTGPGGPGGTFGPGGFGPGGFGPGGPQGPGRPGGWMWVPGDVLKKPWRKRHPFLFWGLALLIVYAAASYALRWAKEDGPLSGPKIAVINVEGMILDSDAVVSWIESVRANPKVRGAVVRVNSPGGAVGPSQEIYRAVKRLAAKKYTVVSMGAVAASGGYYVALGSGEIFAGPSTLTASIGVKMQIPNMEKLMNTIGLSEKTLATGALKDAGSAWRDMRPDEEAYLKDLMNDMYQEFLSTVAENRRMPLEKVKALADGRAMTGRQALAAGLVDKLGDKQDAIESVRAHYGLPSPPTVVEGPEKPVSMLKELMGAVLSLEAEQRAKSELPQLMY